MKDEGLPSGQLGIYASLLSLLFLKYQRYFNRNACSSAGLCAGLFAGLSVGLSEDLSVGLGVCI